MNISSAQFNEAYKRLPLVVREYLAGSELGEIVGGIGAKYSLHVDTIGAVDREVGNMLLGFENPQQFIGELHSVGVPDSVMGPFVQELNEKIFMPLHQKVREAPSEPEPTQDEDELENSVSENLNIPEAAPPKTDAMAYMPQAAPVLAQTPSYARAYEQPPTAQPVVAAIPPTPPAPLPAVAPSPTAPQTIPTQNPVTAANVFPPASFAQIPVPPEQIGRPAVAPTSTPAPSPMPASQNSARDELHKILKEYGVDPYREPVSEGGLVS